MVAHICNPQQRNLEAKDQDCETSWGKLVSTYLKKQNTSKRAGCKSGRKALGSIPLPPKRRKGRRERREGGRTEVVFHVYVQIY
jgi:hypothetical protein